MRTGHFTRRRRAAALVVLSTAALMSGSCTTKTPNAGAASAASGSSAQSEAPAAPDTAAVARDAAERAARRCAEDWLALVDGGKYEGSWDFAAEVFKNTTSKEKWRRAAADVRAPLGALELRRFRAAQYEPRLSEASQGHYVSVHFDTTFAKKAAVREIVTATLARDESWKVAGYFIQ